MIFFLIINAIGELFTVVAVKLLLINLISDKNLSDESIDFFLFKFEDGNIYTLGIFLLISLFLVFAFKIITLSLITKFSGKTGTIISTRIFSENLLTKYYRYQNFESN